jgi:hypothetical protein
MSGGAGTAGSEEAGQGGNEAGSGGQSGTAGSAGQEGCVDIRITPDLLPDADAWISGAFGVFGDRDHFWRDSQGVHVLWKPYSAEMEVGPVYLSTFDPKTGEHLGSIMPPELEEKNFGVPVATGIAPDETVAVGSGILVDGKGRSAVALLRTDGSKPIKIVELQPITVGVILGIGWDGEAFAVHIYPYSSGQLFVTRLSVEGEILSPLQPFGYPPGFWDDIRVATNPISGVSLAVNTANFAQTTVAGHDREGNPLPSTDYPGKPLIEILFPEELASKFPAGGHSVSASPTKEGGFLVAWSRGEYENPTVVQKLGADLRASEEAVLIPAQTPYEGYPNLAIQSTTEGFWLVGKSQNLRKLEKVGELLEVETLIETKANVLPDFDLRVFTAREWKGERWVGFLDLSAPKFPLRILKVSPGCTYPWLTKN